MRCTTSGRALLVAASLCLLAGCEDSVPSNGAPGGQPEQDGGEPAPACTVKAPTKCTDPNIRYADVQPIIKARCLSCHDGKGEEWGLTSYSHVASWFAEVNGVMKSCTMPPPASGLKMPNAEREKLLLWIVCGYKE